MKKLIVNADDFGLNDETVDWTIKGFECGALTSATIMAGMPATERAVNFAKEHPEFSFGVHLCLVDEKPLSDPKLIPSMIDPRTGMLWSTRQFIFRNFLGLVRVADIMTEMRAQVDQIRAMGLVPSHFDGHGHNHRLPQSIRAMRELGFAKVRRCQDLVVGREGLLSRLINRPMQSRMDRIFVCTDHFAMNAGHADNPQWFSELVSTLPDGVTEIGVHPGESEPWRKLDIDDCYANCRMLCHEHDIQMISYYGF